MGCGVWGGGRRCGVMVGGVGCGVVVGGGMSRIHAVATVGSQTIF